MEKKSCSRQLVEQSKVENPLVMTNESTVWRMFANWNRPQARTYTSADVLQTACDIPSASA